MKQNENRCRILGIDPGLAASGWGVIEKETSRIRCLAWGCIETAADQEHAGRLLAIYDGIRKVLDAWKPDAGAVETLFFAKNAKSAMPVGEARGVLCLALAQSGVRVYEYTPNAIKQTVVGVGTADKAQVQQMVRVILGLEEAPKPDHAADALGAAICCAHQNTVCREVKP